MEYALTVSDRVNPDDEGRSLATVVRVYQLRGVQHLENSDFEDIWRRDQESLGEDVVKVDEMTVFPSDRVAKPIEVAEGVSFIVVVALVRKPAGTSWRAVYELPLERCPEGRAPHRLVARFVLEGYRIGRLEDRSPEEQQ